MKIYWEKTISVFHCPIISNILSLARFRELRRCMHITDRQTYEHVERGQVGYNKMRQVRWLVNDIRDACMREWALCKFVIIDEMMIQYKGSYCYARNICPRNHKNGASRFYFSLILNQILCTILISIVVTTLKNKL